jgi:hypothetical protein
MVNIGSEGVWRFTTPVASPTPAFSLALRVNGYANSTLALVTSGLRIVKRDRGGSWSEMAGTYAVPGSYIVNRTAVTGLTASDNNEYDICGGTNNPLPVELQSFSASRAGAAVLLRWNTITEANNYGFDVERSVNERVWTTVAFIEGAGTSNSPRDYTYRDALDADALRADVFWYRLRQIDRNGAYSYSPVVNVAPEVDASIVMLDMYPQPLTSGARNATMHFALVAPGTLSLRIYDGLGRDAGMLTQGWYEVGTHVVVCTLPRLNPGTYFLAMSLGGIMRQSKALQVVR